MDNNYNYFTPNNKVYMIIISSLILFLYILGHWIVASSAVLIYIVIVINNIKNLKIKKYEWKKFIENFSSNLDIATRNTLVKLPFPLIIVGDKGSILWYNQISIAMLEGRDILGKNINNIISEFNINEVLRGKKNYYKYVKINKGYYDIFVSIVDTKDNKNKKDKIMLLYFGDVTEKFDFLREINDNKYSTVLVEIDNLDEVVKSTEEDKKPLLIAEIERNINSYCLSLEAIVKKYSSNKYILVAQANKIQNEMEKKFDILDVIREINIGNKLSVTLSMGIGIGGNNPQENYKLAVSAKELALGRGGDQAVVKKSDKLYFYGGKTKEVEKRTKVRARVISQALVELVNSSSNILIMGHINPDIDCIGAGIGLQSVIKAMNKKCNVLLDSTNISTSYIVEKLKNDKEHSDSFISSSQCKNIIDEKTLLILVDVNSNNYVQNQEILNLIKNIVIIDHHRRSANGINDAMLTYIEPYASSACELVTEMVQYMLENYKIKPIEAEALLAGICVDTKNFYFKTGVRTFEAAAYLRRLGADTIDVKKIFANDLDMYIKKSEIIKSAIVEKNIAIANCPPNSEDNILAAQTADELLNITGIQASFVLVKIEGEVIISGRSLGDINVQLILEELGGGGHMTIAGAKVKDSSIEDVTNKLKDAISKYLREGEK